jgi:hypothetical protein
MSEKDEKGRGRRRYPSIVWPVLLIAVGVVVLLSNLGMLEVDFWELWRLWPVLLILVGLDIIFGGRSLLGNALLLLLALVLVGGVVLLMVASPSLLGVDTDRVQERIIEPLEAVEAADLYVGFGAGELRIQALEDSPSLLDARLALASEHKPVWRIDREEDRASLALEYEEGVSFDGWNWRGRETWTLSVSPAVALRLQVDVGAGEATLDLRGLDLRDLEVQAGASQTTVIFPGRGDIPAQVRGGAGALILEIPEAMEARITVDEGLRAVNASARYQQQSNVYQTAGWESSSNRVDVEVRVGVGLVTIREP